jgi:hypothetical protein
MEGDRIESNPELSRGEVLWKGVLAAGAVAGLAAGPLPRAALGAEARGDGVEALNFLLPFEYLQASIHNRAKSEVNDKGEKLPLDAEQKQLVDTLLAEDGAHVAALKKKIEELGGKPVKKGGYAFAFRDFSTYLRLAGEIETYSVGAYNGVIPSIRSSAVRELASSIAQVDGRHAAALLIPNKEEPAPEAFDIGLNESSAITLVEKFTGIFPDY